MSRTFLYFAYGSNMLAKRIHINNPTAVKRDIGKLKNFRLDFASFSDNWKGAVATIVPTANDPQHVWGVIWEIDMANMPNLDVQEGVQAKIYFPMTVDVENVGGVVSQCRVYQQCNNPEESTSLSNLPNDRRPSPLYLKTMIKGARDNELPSQYIELLESIPDNGYNAPTGLG